MLLIMSFVPLVVSASSVITRRAITERSPNFDSVENESPNNGDGLEELAGCFELFFSLLFTLATLMIFTVLAKISANNSMRDMIFYDAAALKLIDFALSALELSALIVLLSKLTSLL